MRLLLALIAIAMLPNAFAGIELSPEILSRLQNQNATKTVVIYSGPNAQSAAPFLQPLLPDEDDPVDDEAGAVHPSPRGPIPFSMRDIFPIHAEGMQPGYYKYRPALDPQYSPAAPLCVLGTDNLSREWLVANRIALQENGARCICIDAQTLESWQSLSAMAPELQILPAPVDFASLGLDRYPMLIMTSGEVMQ